MAKILKFPSRKKEDWMEEELLGSMFITGKEGKLIIMPHAEYKGPYRHDPERVDRMIEFLKRHAERRKAFKEHFDA